MVLLSPIAFYLCYQAFFYKDNLLLNIPKQNPVHIVKESNENHLLTNKMERNNYYF